jgi:sec-independent protein translocase protein TatA
MLGNLGPTELIIILFIVLILFGAGKLPEIGGALGKGLRNFKKATREPEEIDITPPAPKEIQGEEKSGTQKTSKTRELQ